MLKSTCGSSAVNSPHCCGPVVRDAGSPGTVAVAGDHRRFTQLRRLAFGRLPEQLQHCATEVRQVVRLAAKTGNVKSEGGIHIFHRKKIYHHLTEDFYFLLEG